MRKPGEPGRAHGALELYFDSHKSLKREAKSSFASCFRLAVVVGPILTNLDRLASSAISRQSSQAYQNSLPATGY